MKIKKRIEIDITLSNKNEIFNPFNKDQLSDELSNYIYNQCKGKPIKNNISINIMHSFEIKNEEKKEIVDAIRSNFGIDIKENTLRLKYELLVEFILILIGSVLIITSNYFDNLHALILGEIISIFGCVIIWEVAYNLIFTDTKTLIENKRLKKLTKAKISFKKEN